MKKIVAILAVLVMVVVAYFLLVNKSSQSGKYKQIVPKIGSIAIEFRETGTVNPRNRLEIKPQVSGRIENILVAEGQKVKKGEVIAWLSSTDRAALLDIARSKGEEELKKWEDTYKPTPVISPIDGFVIVRNKEPGQTVTLNDVILVIADELIIEADVDETDLRYIKLGQKVEIFLDSYPEKKFYGIVEHIAYESRIVSNVTVYKVKIRPESIPENFRAGMTATVEVVANKKSNVLLLPADAVIERDNRKFVMIKSDKSKPELRKIETGITDGKKVEIVSGISEDDIVLVAVKGSKKDAPIRGRFGGIPGIGGGVVRFGGR